MKKNDFYFLFIYYYYFPTPTFLIMGNTESLGWMIDIPIPSPLVQGGDNVDYQGRTSLFLAEERLQGSIRRLMHDQSQKSLERVTSDLDHYNRVIDAEGLEILATYRVTIDRL